MQPTSPGNLTPRCFAPGRFDDKVYIPLPDLPARRKLLDLYLSHRPLAADVDLDLAAKQMEGFSGADIKYICDRSATIPFLESVATGKEGDITAEILNAAIGDAPKSVTKEMLQRFDQWASAATAG